MENLSPFPELDVSKSVTRKSPTVPVSSELLYGILSTVLPSGAEP